ncbi:hypothetical protein JHK87_042494 [Glycine soja]|nr:hypothetical protein JHK87_042494 [Glycine soja]
MTEYLFTCALHIVSIRYSTMVVDAFDITVAVTAWMVLLLKEKSIEQHQEGNFIAHCKHHHQPRQDKHFQNKVA